MEESNRHIGFRRESPNDVYWSELSYLVSVHPSDRRDCNGVHKAVIFVFFLLLGLSFVLFLGGPFAARQLGVSEIVPVIAAAVLLPVGLVFGYFKGYILKRVFAKRLGSRSELLFEPDHTSVMVGIEDPFTYDKQKLAPEDFGLMQIAPGLIQLEMTGHRARFAASDLKASIIFAHKNAVAVRLSLKDAQFPWSVAMSPFALSRNILDEGQSKKKGLQLYNRLLEAGVRPDAAAVEDEPIQPAVCEEQEPLVYASATEEPPHKKTEETPEEIFENADLLDHQYQTILNAIRSKEKSRKGWAKSAVILIVSLLIFFQLGFMRWGLNAAAAILTVIAIHELGHFIGMKAFGYKNIQMFFIPLAGAAVSGTGCNVAAWKKALVTLMGPLPGIMLGVALAIVGLFGFWKAIEPLALMFLVINLLNLLPIFPLDGGRFLHEVLFSRSRILELSMNILAAAALLIAGFGLNDWILRILGFLNLFTIGYKFKMATAAAKMRLELLQKNPSLLDKAGQEGIPEHILKKMIVWMRQNIPGSMKPNTIGTMAVDLWDRIRILPPRAGATVGLLLLYLFGYVMAFAGFVAVGVRHWQNAIEKTEIVTVVNADGNLGYVEKAFQGGELYAETQLTDDTRHYHGWQRLYDAEEPYVAGCWDNGKKVGTWSYRNRQGQVCYSIEYEEGRPAVIRTLCEEGEWQETRWEDFSEDIKVFYLQTAAVPQGPAAANQP